MKVLIFFALLFASLFSSRNAAAQQAELQQLTTEMMDESGLVPLSSMPGWKYYPGDKLQWADPGFDDSGWHDIAPGELRADAMPDSLWNGYGWWRFSFKADSTLTEQLSNLYFSGWGAAEVFLNGQKVASYGRFSIDQGREKTYTPGVRVNNPMQSIAISPGETHLLAIRYSNHPAKRNHQLFNKNAVNLGFGFGFADNNFRNKAGLNHTYSLYTAIFGGSLLLFLALTHFMLFLRLRQDKSNLLISFVTLLFLLTIVSAYLTEFFEMSGYWRPILSMVWHFSFFIAASLLPYVVSVMFKLERYYWTKQLAWLGLIAPAAIFFLFEEGSGIVDAIWGGFSLLIFVLLGLLMMKAIRMKIYGVKYVFAGALASLIFVIIAAVSSAVDATLSLELMSLLFLGAYTSFPVGLSLYVNNQYGYLYSSMENEVKERTKDLNDSLQNLKETQDQLIQQEKLASLGQLTAGIAHEIKNPLNFVNKFSEVSVELVEEARDELSAISLQLSGKDNVEKAVQVQEILNDIGTNLTKIHEHGTRADGIVQSMLMHSRGSNGKKEPTPFNPLVKEYVNLAFHGMRAGKEPVDIDIQLDLDESVGEVPLIAEDFSRVIVNLCNNAFDACAERSRSEMKEKGNSNDQAPNSNAYIPKLTVRTIRDEKIVTLEIVDNGPGIPVEIKNKILQPFFTTKKGTQGTGLGLSITNDIVKAHGGTLEIKSIPSEKTILKITLIK